MFSYLIAVSSKLLLSQPAVFTFVLPILLSSVPQEEGEVREQLVVWSFSGTLNSEIPFLNHDTDPLRKKWSSLTSMRLISPELEQRVISVCLIV